MNKLFFQGITSLIMGVIFAFVSFLLLPYPFSSVFWGLAIASTLSVFLLLRLYHWAGNERSLAILISIAFLLRFGLGLFFTVGLPIFGYDTEAQQAGYLFRDAYERDQQAWQLATSDMPIWRAFTNEFVSDQYGGLLAFSAIIYRILSPEVHNPLIIIIFSALFSTIVIPILWKTLHSSDRSVKMIAVSLVAFYPDILLLSASQMREPFILGFSSIMFWLVNMKEVLTKKNLVVFLLSAVGLFLISTRVFLIIIAAIGLWFFLMKSSASNRLFRNRWVFRISLGCMFIILLLSLGWVVRAGQWDAYLLEQGSGWVQKIIAQYGEEIRVPFATVYGLLQPVLPAAIVEPSIAIWKWIAIVRSVGWYLLIPFFAYGMVFAMRKQGKAKFSYVAIWSLLALWVVISSLRAGGDLWDNPRYRIHLFVLMAVFVAEALVFGIKIRDHWLWRIIAAEVIFLVVFLQWYISRYTNLFGKLEFVPMILLITILVLIIFIWGLVVEIIRSKKLNHP